MKYDESEIMQAVISLGLSKSIASNIIANLPKKRSGQENKSLHVLFANIAYELNNMGIEFTYKGITGVEMQTIYTQDIVKEQVWKPLQKALLSKSSTTELTHKDIEMMFEILGRFFSERDVYLEFPSVESLRIKSLTK